jgi:hypothetical protein
MVASVVLAVCGGGGNNTAALVVLLLAGLAWLLAARAAIAGGGADRAARFPLSVLLAIAIVLGAAAFLVPGAFSGDYLRWVVLAPLAAGAIGVGLARSDSRFGVARALAVSLVGVVLVPGGLIALFIASLLIGSGCLE